jgi:hypothetical protein
VEDEDDDEDDLEVLEAGRRKMPAKISAENPRRGVSLANCIGQDHRRCGFVEAARLGVLILTHRRLLVSQFERELTAEGYADRFTPAIVKGPNGAPLRSRPTRGSRGTSTRSRARPTSSSSPTRRTRAGREDERRDPLADEPIFIGMTATEHDREAGLDVFPASVDDLHSRTPRGAGLRRSLAAHPAGRRDSPVPIIGGDFDGRAREGARPRALNQAAVDVPRPFRLDTGHVYAAASSTLTTSRRNSSRRHQAEAGRADAAREARRTSPPTSAARSTS